MKYAADIGSGAVTYTLDLIKSGSDIQKLMAEAFTDTRTAWKSHKPTFIFSKQGK
jgi:hypothetical protein